MEQLRDVLILTTISLIEEEEKKLSSKLLN